MAGTYVGTLPAADCPGIETELILHPSGEYELTSEYIDRDTRFTERGNYRIEGRSVLVCSDRDGESAKYRIEGDALRMLDTEGKVVKGCLADGYLLKKVEKK